MPGRPVGEEPRRLHPGGDAGERAQRGLGGVLTGGRGGLLERGLRHADRARRDVDASGLEARHDVTEAAPLDAPHEVRGGHGKALEDQLGGVHALVAELGDGLDDVETRRPLLHDEAGHAPVRRVGGGVGAREQGEGIALAAIGHEHLRARDEVVVALAARHRLNGLHVGAGMGLGEAEPAPRGAAGEAGQEARALLVGAVVEHDEGGHGVAVDDAGERHPAAAELLDDARVDRHAEPEAAVGRWARARRRAPAPACAPRGRADTRRRARARGPPARPRPRRSGARRRRWDAACREGLAHAG